MKAFRLSEAAPNLRALAQGMNAAAERGLYAAALRLVAHIKGEIIPSTEPSPVGRGAYRAAWDAARMPGGAQVYNSVPYSAMIEEGVPASSVKIGRKMIDALADWVRMKGIGGRVVTSKSGVTRLVRATQDEARSIAWAIAKSMQQRGIFAGGQGLKVFARAWERAPEFARTEVLRELSRES